MKTLAVVSGIALSNQCYLTRYLADLYSRLSAEIDLSVAIIDVSEGDARPGYACRSLAVERLPLTQGLATGRLLSLISRAHAVHVVSPFDAAGEVSFAISVYARKAIGVVQLTPVSDSLVSTTRLSRAIRHAVAPNSYLAGHLSGTLGCPVFPILPRAAPVFQPAGVPAKGELFVLPPCNDTDWPAIVAAIPPGAELCIPGGTGDSTIMDTVARHAPGEIKIKTDWSDSEVCNALQRAVALLDWPVAGRVGSDARNNMTAFSYAIDALACGTPVIVSGLRSYSRDLRELSGCSIPRTPAELAASVSRFAQPRAAHSGTATQIARELRLAIDSPIQLRLLANAVDALAGSR